MIDEELKEIEFVDATEEKTREQVEGFYKEHPEKTLKTLVMKAYSEEGSEFIAVITRGDLKVDLEKLKTKLNLTKVRFAQKEELERLGLVMGYISSIDCKMKIIVDKKIEENKNYYDGGNKQFLYRKNVNFQRDFKAWKEMELS